VRRQAGAWVVEGPLGEVGFKFVLRNSWGVLDHVITLPNGQEIFNPMRVVANGPGSEVLFTLFQPEEMSDLQFVEDLSTVERDLRRLKQILEQGTE
jgi:hypothetical protein